MNGVSANGHHANGSSNGVSSTDHSTWTVGLINCRFRYLTAETFGFKINANGTSLKKKQMWTLEPAQGASGEDAPICLKSHLGRYLAVDQFGNVTCDSEDRNDAGTVFHIEVSSDSNDSAGKWALRNVSRGYYLGASGDKLTCAAKGPPSDSELWVVHLAARPQVNLRSIGRRRFAHLSPTMEEIQVDANVAWGEDTLFTLEFHDAGTIDNNIGGYALHSSCNGKYLHREGRLLAKCTRDCIFSAEYHAGYLCLRDRHGLYLSPIGSKAVLKTRSQTITKDELFTLEDSLPQASFVSGLNARFVSVKQGVDVTANQDEISDHETFQLEWDSCTGRWYLRTMQDKYWTLEAGGGIQASADKRSSNALFQLHWMPDGSMGFRANNGKWIAAKRSGHLYANADNCTDDNSKFYFYLINRPVLVLKCEQGFVGYKSASSPRLECNKANYEAMRVERGEKGLVRFKGSNGKYWRATGDGITAEADEVSSEEGFYLELREPAKMCIKTSEGSYLCADKNGVFRVGSNDYETATKWEY